jgi:ribosomal protein S18 acetylase RimI-like enzyme
VTPVPAERVHAAHADAWEAEGRLREGVGGGVLAVRGARLMASGLPERQWNGGDVTAPDADLDAARAFFARRGVDFGLRVPAGMRWRHGRRLRGLRIMALDAARFRPAPEAAAIAIRAATPDDLDTVVAVDAAAFASDPAVGRPWLAAHLGAEHVDTALAALDGVPAATGYAIRTDGAGGPALYLGGVGVVPAARRRGVGTAVSSWLVARGVASGAQIAHLHADTVDAARIYARLGFADTEPLDVYVDL